MSRIGNAPIPVPDGVTVTTTAENDEQALALLRGLGLPFAEGGTT